MADGLLVAGGMRNEPMILPRSPVPVRPRHAAWLR